LGDTLIRSILIAYLFFASLSVVLYIPKLVQLLYAFKKPPHKIANEKRKISLVIPARNEHLVIGDLFDSILRQDYDRDYFDVNVIVKEADDPTVALAEKIGARVFVVPDQTCKGAALDGYFKQLEKEQFDTYDAFVIIDADAVLDDRYLTELNNALETDIQIYITRKRIKNFLKDKSSATLFSNCSALTYPMLDDLANNYRTKKGIPMNMCGQGMMIRRDVIEKIGGWPYRTLTEDYELRMDCFLKGFSSMYYPYAIIYTEEVVKHKDSYNRRLRWVTGFSQCDRLYKKRIRQQAKQRKKMTLGEFEYFFSLYPLIMFIVTTILTVCAGGGLAIFYALRHDPLWWKAVLILMIYPPVAMYVLVFLYCLLAMLAFWDAFRTIGVWKRIATLLFAPIFMLEYFPIFIQSRFYSRTSLAWEQTARVVLDTKTPPPKKEEPQTKDDHPQDIENIPSETGDRPQNGKNVPSDTDETKE